MSEITEAEIWYDGIRYPIKEVTIFEGEQNEELLIVAPIRLERILIPDGATPTSDEAELTDNEISFYCHEDEWNLPDEELIQMLEENFR